MSRLVPAAGIFSVGLLSGALLLSLATQRHTASIQQAAREDASKASRSLQYAERLEKEGREELRRLNRCIRENERVARELKTQRARVANNG